MLSTVFSRTAKISIVYLLKCLLNFDDCEKRNLMKLVTEYSHIYLFCKWNTQIRTYCSSYTSRIDFGRLFSVATNGLQRSNIIEINRYPSPHVVKSNRCLHNYSYSFYFIDVYISKFPFHFLKCLCDIQSSKGRIDLKVSFDRKTHAQMVFCRHAEISDHVPPRRFNNHLLVYVLWDNAKT